MAEGITIRHARAGDAAALVRLASQLGYEVTADQVVERLGQLPETDEVLVAEAGGEPVGWVHLAVYRTLVTEPSATVLGLVVAEEWRHRGIGRRLMDLADGYATHRGLSRVSLRSNVIRHEAHDFYARLGFEETKRQVALVRPVRVPAPAVRAPTPRAAGE